MALVAEKAREAMNGDEPASSDVVLRIAYFFLSDQAADLDNIVKPIQDALKEISFHDDKQVIDLIASAMSKMGTFRINMTGTLADGFSGGSDFVHVVVEDSSTIEALR